LPGRLADPVSQVADLDFHTQVAADGFGVPAQRVDLGEFHLATLNLGDPLLTDAERWPVQVVSSTAECPLEARPAA
jgi:hypothetical protein